MSDWNEGFAVSPFVKQEFALGAQNICHLKHVAIATEPFEGVACHRHRERVEAWLCHPWQMSAHDIVKAPSLVSADELSVLWGLEHDGEGLKRIGFVVIVVCLRAEGPRVCEMVKLFELYLGGISL